MSESKIKTTLEEILGSVKLKPKKPTKREQKKDNFCTALSNMSFLNQRTNALKHDYGISIEEWDDFFYSTIDSFMKMQFEKPHIELINWWVYDKFQPNGDVLILMDTETGDEIPSDTPEDIWNIVYKS